MNYELMQVNDVEKIGENMTEGVRYPSIAKNTGKICRQNCLRVF